MDFANEIASRRAPHASRKRRSPSMAVALSGGGYRAALFHVGALRRMNDFGLLAATARFSSVSGGSIVAGVLASRWERLDFDAAGVAMNFAEIEQCVDDLTTKTLDIRCGLVGLVPGLSAAESLAKAYRQHLFGDMSLQDLPDSPRFTFNTTNFTTGAVMRWAKEYAADYKAGTIFEPDVPLASVVAASSAFPPVLSPLILKTHGVMEDHDTRAPINPQPSQLTLTDGGVYDNHGMQAVDSFHTVLSSDGGATLPIRPIVRSNWFSQSLRTTAIINSQVRAQRTISFFKELDAGERLGAMWTIATDMSVYSARGTIGVDPAVAAELATVPTRLKALPERTRQRLINFGFAHADAAIRSRLESGLPAPRALPYPDASLS